MASEAISNAVSGLQCTDVWLDVIGNNIANVDTTAFKASRMLFAAQLSQKISNGSGGAAQLGRTNPSQIGTGTRVESIQTLFKQGTLQNTGDSLDVGVEGDGFLQVKKGGSSYLTRAGNLSLDSDGYLVDAQGGLVQGYSASYQLKDKVLSTVSNVPGQELTTHQSEYVLASELSSIRIQPDMTLPPKATTKVEFSGNLDAAQQATDSGGVFDLGTWAQPVLPIALNIWGYGPWMAVDSTRLTAQILPSGGFAFQQVANLSTTMAYPITNGMIDIGLANSHAGNYAWEQVPPIPPTSTVTSVVYDSTGFPREVTVLFYQVNDLGDGGVNPSSGPNQAVYAWYAFETTGGIQPQTDHLLGGTGIIEGDCQPMTGQWYYDRGRSGDLYAGDFIWFNTDGSLASTGGSGGPNPTPPGQPNYMTVPRVYIPAMNVNPPISPLPTQGADTLAVDLDFGTGGLLGDGKRDGLYSDAAGSYETINGINKYVPASTASATSQDGYPEGRLESMSWDSRGVLNGEFSNGQYAALARLGLARVANSEGLESVDGNAFVQTANSGDLYSGIAGQNGLGVVRGGTLEASNVDLSTELVDMIIAQRGFDANAQVLKTADEMEKARVHLGE